MKSFNSQEKFAQTAQSESIIDRPDKQKVLQQMLANVYENRPDIESFVGVQSGNARLAHNYTQEGIAENLRYVESTLLEIEKANVYDTRGDMQKLEQEFQLSELLQAMIVDRLNKHWFKDCKAIMTSVFDDLKVGIDAVMKHKNGGYLGLSFDFTVGEKDTINSKLEKQWQKTTRGEISTINYFEDPDTKQKGSLIVPRFIIGASKRDTEELAEAYLTNDQAALNNHPFKYVMLKQIEEQLQTALDFYETDPLIEKHGFAKKKYEDIQRLLRILQTGIQSDEKIQDQDLFKYLEDSTAYREMRKFRVSKDRQSS